MASLEDKLQGLVDAAYKKQTRYSEIILYCEQAIEEIERLREFEFMYQGLCD
jgi:peptide subunit release factor 1 (eRF1)